MGLYCNFEEEKNKKTIDNNMLEIQSPMPALYFPRPLNRILNSCPAITYTNSAVNAWTYAEATSAGITLNFFKAAMTKTILTPL